LKTLVEDAVLVEPVSALKFPANREINREFCRIRPSTAVSTPSQRANSVTCSFIPYAPEQGFFDRVSGKMIGGAGSFHAELPTFRAIRWPLPSSKLGSSGPFPAPRWFGQFINRDYSNSTLIAVVRQRHPPLGHSAGCR
jgi:hypothetical protein